MMQMDSYAQTSAKYGYRQLMLDVGLRKVFVNNKPVELKNIDFKILLLLAKNQERCVSRDEIFAQVWKFANTYRSLSDEALLNTHISIIRKRLKQVDEQVAKYIITEKCYGYRLGKDYFAKDDE
jgi:DNA-binding response OmpR family regulator